MVDGAATYALTDATLTAADLVDVTVAGLAAAQAAAVNAVHADSIVFGATNGATITVNNGTYTLTDGAVDLGATPLDVATAQADLAAAQLVIDNSSNAIKPVLAATYTLADSLANIANPDNSAIVTGHSYTLTDDTGSLGALSVANATLVSAASNHDSYNYSISDTILAANGQNFTTGFTDNTGVTLTGSTGDQTVTGSAFADIIAGGAGADTLTGGAGADTFVFITATDSVVGSFDSITDFVSGTDKIQTGVTGGGNSLNQGAFYTEAGTGSLIDDIANAVINGNMQGMHIANANDIYVVSITGIGAGTYVYQDANGDETVGADELVIQLAGVSIPLTAGDFIA